MSLKLQTNKLERLPLVNLVGKVSYLQVRQQSMSLQAWFSRKGISRTNTLAYFVLSVSDEDKNCLKLAP
jgi:hypothetical protein